MNNKVSVKNINPLTLVLVPVLLVILIINLFRMLREGVIKGTGIKNKTLNLKNELNKKAGEFKVEISEEGDEFTEEAKKAVKNVKQELTKRQKEIYSHIKKNKFIEIKDLEGIFQVTNRTLRRDIAELIKKKYIQKEGSTKGSLYRVAK